MKILMIIINNNKKQKQLKPKRRRKKNQINMVMDIKPMEIKSLTDILMDPNPIEQHLIKWLKNFDKVSHNTMKCYLDHFML